MEKSYHGSCHCGAIRFEAAVDLQAGTGKCNCSYCSKVRSWGAIVKPDAFKLVSEPDKLVEYRFGSMSNGHCFCGRCGVHTFSKGHIEEMGGDFVAVQLGALDDATPEELGTAPVTFQNGRDNSWWMAPAHTSCL